VHGLEKDNLEPVSFLHELMTGFERPWFVVGGWAIDLFVGSQSREHDDIEIGIYRNDQQWLRRHLGAWQFTKVVNGESARWNDGELLELPVHELHARSSSPERQLEILLQEESNEHWLYRRNAEIGEKKRDVCLVSNGIPYLRPDIVLLFKAKNTRAKDERDFELVRERLTERQRDWLREALVKCHPEHRWLSSI
jgi:hypothetical protein